MPDALALVALAKVSPMVAPVPTDVLTKAIDEQFHIYSDQQDALLKSARDSIIHARSAILQAESAHEAASGASGTVSDEGQAVVPEVVHASVGDGFLSAWAAWMDFTNRYFNCFKERRATDK
eukprot:symbB.v1.2.036558.t1/scaffold5105.1/size30854/3